MRLPTESGIGEAAAIREASDRAGAAAARQAATPGWIAHRQKLGSSSQAASSIYAGYYVDEDGVGHKRWIVGVTRIGEDWQIGYG